MGVPSLIEKMAQNGLKEPAPKIKRKRGAKSNRHFVNASMEWTYLLQDKYGYATAIVYIHLGTWANIQLQHEVDICVLHCGAWKDFHIDRATWYRALDNLRECGAIASRNEGRDMMRYVVSSEPAKPAILEDLGDFESAD